MGGATGGPIPRSCRVEYLEDLEEGLEDPESLIRGDLREANLCCQSRATVGQDEHHRHELTS